jgi:murein lipoprotein
MNSKSASLALASLLTIFAAGCGTTASKEASAPGAPLSDAAKSALADADASVKAAKANFSLWLPSEDAYKKAQEAAKKGDSATVVKQTAIVMDLNKLAAAQNSYPSTELK